MSAPYVSDAYVGGAYVSGAMSVAAMSAPYVSDAYASARLCQRRHVRGAYVRGAYRAATVRSGSATHVPGHSLRARDFARRLPRAAKESRIEVRLATSCSAISSFSGLAITGGAICRSILSST